MANFNYSDEVIVIDESSTEESEEIDDLDDGLWTPKGVIEKNKKKINQHLREKGKSYIGYRRPPDQTNTYHDIPRSERKLGERCSSNFCVRSEKRKCDTVTDEKRLEIFEMFWNKMNWPQRKAYISSLVKVIDPKERKSENAISRRNFTLLYHLKINNKLVPVCKTMFLSTFCVGQRTVFSWISANKYAQVFINTSGKYRLTKKGEAKHFLKRFLERLDKVPVHSCGQAKEYYLEHFSTVADVYDTYKECCFSAAKETLSRNTLKSMMDDMNILIRQAKTKMMKKCNTCVMYKLENLDEITVITHIKKKN